MQQKTLSLLQFQKKFGTEKSLSETIVSVALAPRLQVPSLW